MHSSATVSSTMSNTRLHAYLTAVSDVDAQQKAEDLIRQDAEPIIWGVLRRCSYRSNQDADVQDAYSDTVFQLLSRLQVMRLAKAVEEEKEVTINNFPGYVKVMTRNTWYHRAGRQHQRDIHAVDLASATDEGFDPFISIPDKVDIARDVCHRATLQRLWGKILMLPQTQRLALLLNLRVEEGDSLSLFTMIGIATQAEIAHALAIPLSQYICLTKQLPLDDEEIAARLSVTRRQVINLRVAARRRLERSMGRLC